MAKLFDFIAISREELGYFMKISINRGQMRYCCSISMKFWGNQYPEIFSVRRSTPEFGPLELDSKSLFTETLLVRSDTMDGFEYTENCSNERGKQDLQF